MQQELDTRNILEKRRPMSSGSGSVEKRCVFHDMEGENSISSLLKSQPFDPTLDITSWFTWVFFWGAQVSNAPSV